MTEALYTLEILRLAAETALAPRLANPDATAVARSTVCGSSMIVDLSVDAEGHVADYGHEVRACALGQASATLLARHVVGRTLADLIDAHDVLRAYLAGTSHALPDWPDLAVLASARPYPARHAAVRLPFEAALEAATHATARTAA